MSKSGDTKRKIIEMLKQKSLTMTDISRRLELAPSTVTQHLQEMEDAGIIKLVRSRRLKYYELNEYPPIDIKQGMPNIRRMAVPLAILALVALLGLSYYAISSSSIYASAQQVYVAQDRPCLQVVQYLPFQIAQHFTI